MSHLANERSLFGLWKVNHRWVGIAQLRRLRDFIVTERPTFLPRFHEDVATRLPDDQTDAVMLIPLLQELPPSLRGGAQAQAILAHCQEIQACGRARMTVH